MRTKLYYSFVEDKKEMSKFLFHDQNEHYFNNKFMCEKLKKMIIDFIVFSCSKKDRKKKRDRFGYKIPMETFKDLVVIRSLVPHLLN